MFFCIFLPRVSWFYFVFLVYIPLSVFELSVPVKVIAWKLERLVSEMTVSSGT